MRLLKNKNSLSWRLVQSDGVDEVYLNFEELKDLKKKVTEVIREIKQLEKEAKCKK